MMGSVAKHVFLVTDPRRGWKPPCAPRSRSRAPAARDRWSSTFPRTCRPQPGYFGARQLAIPGYRQRLRELTSSLLSEAAAASFFELLAQSQRPLIYAGGGVINGGAAGQLAEFAQQFGIPVVTTLMGIGAVDTTHPLSMRMLGMHGAAFANYAVEDCDFLIAVGARFDDRVAGDPKLKFARNARRIAHLDVDPAEINKVKNAHWSHVGLLPEALRVLTAYGARLESKPDFAPWQRQLAELRRAHAMNYDRDSELVQPHYVIEEINRHTRGEAIISTGVGQHQMWAAQMFDFRGPRLWLTSGSMGTMGFGLPAAIGAQVAHPGTAGHRFRRRCEHSHEHRRAGDRHHLRPADQDRGAEQFRRWHGQAVAEAVLQGPLVGQRQVAAQEGLRAAASADGFQWARRLDRKQDVPA
jgi:acetolactate synthase-1/2/3 large subunit